jgi:FixJ family two-component response regulator
VTRPQIYLVDDDQTVLTAMGRLLRACGFDIKAFSSARAFLAHPADADRQSCLIVDVHMPGLSGIDLHRALRAAQRDLPLVFATGAADLRVLEQACSGQTIELLQKPFTDTDLLAAIDRASSRRAQA